MKIKRFNEEYRDVRNYAVSYVKVDSSSEEVVLSIGADDLLDLANRLKSHLSENEFKSIFKIETKSLW